MKAKKGIVWALVLMLLTGCGHQAPQRPSQRLGEAPQADSAQLVLMELNRQLADAADRQLVELVQTQPETYALLEHNTWVHVFDQGDRIPTGDERTIRMRIYTLDGRLLLDSEGSYRLGKYELPQGIEANIGELLHGAKARMFIPWYAAYGVSGTEDIPPYENIRIDIELR